MTPLILTPVKPAYTPKELADDARFFLSEGRYIRIRFTKKDGTERIAVVTSNLSRIPADKHPKYVRSVPAGYLAMFDHDKGDWISCHESQVIGVSQFI